MVDKLDAGTHTVFLGKLVAAENLKAETPMTYAYYHQVKKGRAPKTAPTYQPVQPSAPVSESYQCSICGYVYEPGQGDPAGNIAAGTPFAALPADWVCPVCGAPREAFQRL